VVCISAPRLDRRLLERIVRLDDTTVPIAEVHRRCRNHAAQLDIPRPSYECVRQLIHDARRERALRRSNRETLIRVALYLDRTDALTQFDSTPRTRL